MGSKNWLKRINARYEPTMFLADSGMPMADGPNPDKRLSA